MEIKYLVIRRRGRIREFDDFREALEYFDKRGRRLCIQIYRRC